MRIYSRARYLALAMICASGLAAGIGMAAAPGSALASVNCMSITGSGSSLQGEQLTKWTGNVGTAGFKLKTTGKEECSPGNPSVAYTSTSSGEGLLEFGFESGVLEPSAAGNKNSSLDAFIGTDDPPTMSQITNAETAVSNQTKPVITPVVSAPIAVIVNLPDNCDLTSSKVQILTHDLSLIFSGKSISWLSILKDSPPVGTGCDAVPLVEVRSDSSGTSYAFKQFLCQVEPSVWGGVSNSNECEPGKKLVTDAPTWPQLELGVSTHHDESGKTVENKKSSGEAEAVLLSGSLVPGGSLDLLRGSIGYVNLANVASSTTTTKFEPSRSGALQFWVEINEKEPKKESTKGNCPTKFALGANAELAMLSKWEKVHLASPTTTEAYPICTFTYDAAWESYTGAKLVAQYGTTELAQETGNTAAGFLQYAVSGEGQGSGGIAEDYAALPSEAGSGEPNVKGLAVELASKIN
jgi:ABC-type phosphate transport system substrate-binding protein